MRSNTPLSLAEIREACPAVFQSEARQDRSSAYVHISTEPVLAAMQAAGFGVSRAQQTRSRSVDKAGFARHLLAFRPLTSFNEAKVGGSVPEVVMLNSHDGNCSYRLHIGMYRMVCANGMIAGRDFEHVAIRHRGSPALTVVEETQRLFEHYVPRLQKWVDMAESTVLTQRQQYQFATAAQAIRFGKGKPFSPMELVKHIRRPEDEGEDLWHVYNRVQENLLKGGIHFTNENGRSCKTKPINRVTKDVIYNQQLWDLAAEFLPEAA